MTGLTGKFIVCYVFSPEGLACPPKQQAGIYKSGVDGASHLPREQNTTLTIYAVSVKYNYRKRYATLSGLNRVCVFRTQGRAGVEPSGGLNPGLIYINLSGLA